MRHYKKMYINERCIVDTLYEARTFFARLKGLFALKGIQLNEGLYISPCNSIHTFFMSYDIAVIFLSKKNEVVKVVKKIKPFRYASDFKAGSVVEMLPGPVVDEIKVGDKVKIV